MNLQRYLDRIEYSGSIQPNLSILIALHEAHVFSVPFENLDVQLGKSLSICIEDAYEKIVNNTRGGWCYEQNGLFGWVLTEIGFKVTRISANVMRHHNGETSAASHLCLLVKLPGGRKKYLVDVGFGGSLIRPIELAEAQFDQPPFKLGLERLDDGYWRYWEDPGNGKFSFDFTEDPACESSLSRKCVSLQSDPSSNFVLNLVAQQRSRNQQRTLRGRVFSVLEQGVNESKTIDSPEALVAILAKEFRLNIQGIPSLWPGIVARHEKLFGQD